jgi:hypothetical protein
MFAQLTLGFVISFAAAAIALSRCFALLPANTRHVDR